MSAFLPNSTASGNASTVVPLRHRSIGALLIDAGRLRPEDAERILRVQRERKLRFGEAALELGLLSEDDIRFALQQQYDHVVLPIGDPAIDGEVLAAFRPGHFAVEALRQLRTQILLRWLDPDAERRCLSIIGSDPRVGRSFIAANLAVLFSQLGGRTLLIDADLRNPKQHRLFRIGNDTGLVSILSDRGGLETVQRIDPLPNLSVLPAGPKAPNPQELLSRASFTRLMSTVAQQFDVVLIDTSPWDLGADAQIVSARAGAAVLITRQDHTSIRSIDYVVASLRDSEIHLIGSVVNRF